jgi:hypothetical protein
MPLSSPPIDRIATPPLPERRWPGSIWPVLIGLTLIWLGLLAKILALNGGIFTYTLDDPYIHLAFSEQLMQGHFALVAGQPASPSSSILYPLLMMPLAGTALHVWQPLAWNLLALLAGAVLWRHLFDRLVFEAQRPLLAAAMTLLAMLLLNQIGVAFSGMEAGPQIACSLAVAVGMIGMVANDRLRWWLPAAIVLGPLLRYESLAVSLPALVALALWGRWRLAALCLAGIVVVLGGYALYCQSLGLPPVPGSVLAKSGFGGGAGGWSDLPQILLGRLRYILSHGRLDIPALLLVPLLVANLLTSRRRRREGLLILLALAALLAQFALGGYGTLARYEIHAWAYGIAVAAYVNRATLRWLADRVGAVGFAIGWTVLLVCLFPYAVYLAFATPWAANDIYLQQYQMHRLLVDFVRAPALINDAGLTAYRNPYGIVDIVGLGSEKIRRLRRDGQLTPEAVAALAADVKLAVVYADWLPVPAGWQPVAVLHLDRRRVSAAENDVTIFAVRPDDRPQIVAALQRFAPTLPRGARLLWQARP